MNIAGGEMQNIHPVLQPYLETLSMFWNFEEKKGKKIYLIMITNQKTWGFFYQMHAGIHSIYIYGTVSTGNLYCSGKKSESNETAN